MEQYTVRQAAATLGVSGRTILYRLKRGLMRGEQLGGFVWVIPADEIERWRGRGKIKPGRQTSEDSRARAAGIPVRVHEEMMNDTETGEPRIPNSREQQTAEQVPS